MSKLSDGLKKIGVPEVNLWHNPVTAFFLKRAIRAGADKVVSALDANTRDALKDALDAWYVPGKD